MEQHRQPQFTPQPSDEEAAALFAALHAHLSATRAVSPPPPPATPIWAVAGRLASQGKVLTYAPGTRPGWGRN